VRRVTAAICAFVACMAITSGRAKPADHDRAETQALELAKQAIALRSVRGPGNQVPQVAALFKAALVAGGFNEADVSITPVDDTAFSSLVGGALIPSSSRS
jgi:carboxypeptidase PM20D1